jgi:ribosome-associated toxin RatA of RatAB toxin-antitoxin module
MAEVKKLVLVEFTPAQMFDLVDGVEAYRDFLPWCGGAELLSRTETHTVATIHINYHGVKAHFTTENEKRRPHEMHICLKDGPFRHLDGRWHFKPLGDTACKVEFELQYQFSSKLLEKAFGPVFNHIANTFVDSFVKRAEQMFPKNE